MKNLLLKLMLATIVGAALSILFNFAWTPSSKVSTILEVGKIEDEIIQDPQVIIAQIRSDALMTYVCKEVGGDCSADSIRKKLTLYQVGEGLFISCRDKNVSHAIRICEQAVSTVLKEHEKRIQQATLSTQEILQSKGRKPHLRSSKLLNGFPTSIKVDKSELLIGYFIIFTLMYLIIFSKAILTYLKEDLYSVDSKAANLLK